MQPLVVDAVEVSDLVDERGVHLVLEVVEGVALRQVLLPEDDDPVGQLTEPVLAALGRGDAVVHAEQVRAVLGFVLDDEDDVVEPVDHLVRQQVEFVGHQLLEVLGRHLHHEVIVTQLPGESWPRRAPLLPGHHRHHEGPRPSDEGLRVAVSAMLG